MTKTITHIILTVIVTLLAVWAFLKIDHLPAFSDLFSPKKVTIENTPVVVKQIRALSQLVTVSMYEEIVVDSNAHEAKQLKLPLLPGITLYNEQKTLVIIGKVTTHIGINMQKLSTADISGTTDSIHIVLPEAEVLDAILNPSGVSVFIEQGNWSSNAVTSLKNKIRYIAVADAKSRGLLSQSEDKARQILTDFFKAAGYDQVVIQFKGKPIRQS